MLSRSRLLLPRFVRAYTPAPLSGTPTIVKSDTKKPKAAKETLTFGSTFSDHMLAIEWTREDGWKTPLITPYAPLVLEPSCSVFHYGETRTHTVPALTEHARNGML
jgi:hypothetical protein